MRIFISADLEGVAGVTHPLQTEPGRPEHAISCRLMTAECNAAIEGALAGGAQEVVVADAHWHMRNLLVDELHPAAELIQGMPRPMQMVQGMGPGFDAAFFLGYHGAAGTRDAVIDHTYADEREVLEVRINGRRQSEGSLNGYLCGYFGCPLALVSGDSAAVAQMHEFVTELEGVVVKEGLGRYAARSLHPTRACERIRTAAERALQRLDNIPLMKLEGDLELAVDFVRTSMADQSELMPGVRRPGPRTVGFRSGDYLELYRAFLALVALGGTGSE